MHHKVMASTINYKMVNTLEVSGWDRTMYILPLLFALIVTGILSQCPVPHQLIAMLMGGMAGAMFFSMPVLGQMEGHFWNPSNVQYAVHPVMILKLTYGMDRYMLVNSLPQILVICTIGVFTFTLTFGWLLNMLMPLGDLKFVNCVAAGITLAAIDVPDILLELHQIKNLQMLMDTESILSTAFCFICYELVIGTYFEIITVWYQYVCIIIRYVGLSVLVGYFTGKAATFVILTIFDDSLNIITTIYGTSYLLYMTCERDIFCSGCLAVFVCVYQISQGMSKLSFEVDKNVRRFIDISYNSIELLNSIALSATVIYYVMTMAKGFDIPLAICVYILGNILRLVIFILLSPILSRLGFGFEFATMFTISWGSKRGSLQLLQVLQLYFDKIVDILGTEILCFSIVFLILILLINMTTIKMILRRFGLLELSQSRKNNIIYCFKLIKQNSNRLISTLKMNRFYTDANWVVINEAIKLTNPFGSVEETNDDILLDSANKEMFCPVCQKTVSVEPSKKEISDLTRDAKLRVLKAKRISYMKQYENGLLDKEEMNVLLQAVEIAMLSSELEIDVQHFLTIFRKKTSLVKFQKLIERATTHSSETIPLSKWKRNLYLLYTNKWYTLFIYIIILMSVINTLIQLSLTLQLGTFYGFVAMDFICAITYVFDFGAKLLASYKRPWGPFLKVYLKNFWRCLEIITMLASVLYTIPTFAFLFHVHIQKDIFLYFIHTFTLLRLCVLVKLLQHVQPRISRFIERLIDERTLSIYSIGKALMVGFDDVLDCLPSILENETIRERLRDKINSDKMIIGMEVGLMEKESPGIMTTVKTRHVIKACLKTMERGVNELKQSGFVDDYEYNKLNVSLQEPWKYIDRWIKPILPKQIFYEMAWLIDDDTIANFLYGNITNKVWEAGDVICQTGSYYEGIFILISGLFKLTYKPTPEMMDSLYVEGALPIKDFLNTRFWENQIEYVMVGNTVGELGLITNRPSCCTIVSDLPSQAFIIPTDILNEALQMSRDPVRGLEARLWKCVSTNLVRKVLEKSNMYTTVTSDHMDAILDRGFIPNVSIYKTINLNEYIQDVVLVEGLVIDFHSREIYTAPSYIPKTVISLLMPRGSNMAVKSSVQPKLFIIPTKGIDEYNIMLMIQSNSVTIEDPPSGTLVHESFALKSKKAKSNINNARIKNAIRRMTNTSSSLEGRTSRTSRTSRIVNAKSRMKPS